MGVQFFQVFEVQALQAIFLQCKSAVFSGASSGAYKPHTARGDARGAVGNQAVECVIIVVIGFPPRADPGLEPHLLAVDAVAQFCRPVALLAGNRDPNLEESQEVVVQCVS